MTDTRTCIKAKVAAGKISREGGRQVLDMMDEFERQHQSRLGPHRAARQAELDAAAELARQAARKRDLLARQVIAQKAVLAAAEAHPKGMLAGALSLLSRDWGDWHGNANIEKLRESIRDLAHAGFVDGMRRFRPDVTGKSRDAAGMANVVRELFGTSTGDASAAAIAKSWTRVAEYLRARFNAAGGDIARLDSWRLPQTHDARAIHEAGFDKWRDAVWDKLDRPAMLDNLTGLPLSDARLQLLLRDVWETLGSDGLNKMTPGQQSRARAKARKFDDAHRVLHFKDAESFLNYHAEFGRGDLFGNLMEHIDRLSNDIAWMEMMGPNPEATRRLLTDTLKKKAFSEPTWAKNQAQLGGIHHFDNVWDDLNGLSSIPVNARLAQIGAGVRSWLQSAQLGSAFISSFSDVGTMTMTAKLNGLDATRMLDMSLKLMASEADKTFAAQMGFVAESWSRIASTGARYSGEVFDQGMMGRVNQTVMNVSLLGPATEARQQAFCLEFVGALARLRKSAWGDLDAGIRGQMEKYGLDAEAWDIARTAPVVERGGAPFMDVKAIARLDNPRAAAVAGTIHRMVLTERDYAVITSDARVRALLRGGSRPGTLAGEFARFIGMYKAFPVTAVTTHLLRGMAQPNWQGRGAYLAAYFGLTTVTGMAALQAKQLVLGKDLRDMTDRVTWGAAMVQGGGAGILGDFLFSDQNRFGGGVAETLAGPAAGMASDFARLTLGNVQQGLRGDDMRLAYDVARFAGRYTPGSSLWYGRLGLERMVIDQLALLDPKTRKGFRDLRRKVLRETGQDFWWPHGQMLPARLPQMAEQPK